MPLAAALSCSASDDAPPPAPPPTGGAGDVGVPACAAGDALLPGRVYFTAAQDVRGFAPGCDEGGLHALVRRGDAWGYQVSADALERPLAGHREGRALAATASGALVEVDLEASPPAFITRDAAGAEASRVAAELPPLRAIDGEADWSFDDVCFSRDGVPTLKQAGGVALELSPPAPGGRAGLLVRTCGYVDLVTFAPDGGPSGRANVVEMPRASTKVIVPLDGFVDASADGASFVAAASRPGRWGGDGAPDRLAIKVVSSSDGATLREGEVAFAGAGTQAAAFRACGARAIVAGERSRQIAAGPNDSDEGDVWAALVDLESMSLVAEATFDVDGDDFAFSVACDAAGDEVYIGGTTGRH
ncbi:MAG TPA: hypothetical protein VFS00_06375, partial [Polyangiaceae bacterium]|nr:hypothetical protein [Polyangiaceae bacterium]